MARELYGPELMKKRVLELNASNERGIDVIRQTHTRETASSRQRADSSARSSLTRLCCCLCVWSGHKVKEFAQIAVGSRDSVPGYPCPPFKISILVRESPDCAAATHPSSALPPSLTFGFFLCCCVRVG